MALIQIALGRTDAHLDNRVRLTPESYLAAAMIVEEAGGCVHAPTGDPIPPADTLTDRRSILAAGTAELAGEITRVLHP